VVVVVDAVVVVVGLTVVVVAGAVVVVGLTVVVVAGAVVVVGRAVVVVGAAVVVVADAGCELASPGRKPALSSASLLKPSPSVSAALRAAVSEWPAFANAEPNGLRVLGLALMVV